MAVLGVQVSLDDFGTGYSSLQYLQNLHVHELKIDRTFVRHMTERPTDAAIVRCAIDMAKTLDLIVVADGVENEHAFDMLAQLGCDIAQGYDIARPLPAAALERWLEDRRAVVA